jgi:hypothetical protein
VAPGLFYGSAGCIVGIVSEQWDNVGVGLRQAFAWGTGGGSENRSCRASVLATTAAARTAAGNGSGQSAFAESPSTNFHGLHVSLHYFDGTGGKLRAELDDDVGVDVTVSLNTPTVSARVRVGAGAGTGPAQFWKGVINRIVVMPWTDDAARIAALRAQLAQRVA